MTTADIPHTSKIDICDTHNDVIPDTSKRDIPVRYRLATPADELHIITTFSKMLRELEPLGHNILPTDRNIDLFWQHIFAPALERDEHGIVVAFTEGECIGATFFTTESTKLDVTHRLATAHGAWVAPEHRQQGIAKRMQDIAHRRLADLGYERLISTVVNANKAGLRSAQAAGAEVIGYFTSVNLERKD